MKLFLRVWVFFIFSSFAFAQLSTHSSWIEAKESDRKAAFELAEEYKAFMAAAKTELSAVREIVALAEKNDFKPLRDNAAWNAGAKYYDVNRDRTICLIVVGRRKLNEGVRLIGGHIDSPRLELKAQPLYERHGFALFQTMYHGGIKKYQRRSPWRRIGSRSRFHSGRRCCLRM
jgi:aspartyl aminopeptidase